MPIEVTCKGCQARYRVKDELAGRTAECKHCGQKFRVPYRSAVVRLGDEEEMAAPAPQPKPAEAKAKRDFVEYGLDPNDPTAPIMKRQKDRPKVAQGILPELVADLWLPLGLMIGCYGIALYVAVNYMLRSNGPLAGMILLGIVTAMFFAFVIPMTMRMIEGASKTLDFEAPNSIWLQTAGLVGLPTAGMVVGFFGAGSVAAMIAFGLIGFVVMIPLMALLLRVDFLKGAQAAVLAGMFYVLSLAGTGAIIAAVALWLMPLWKLTRPWDEPPPPPADVAAATPAPSASSASDKPTEVAAATPTESAKPAPSESIFDKADKAEPVAPIVVWEVAADPRPAVKWPIGVHHMFDVRAPISVIRASPRGPFVGVVDAESTRVFDLRSGKRVGAINERPQNNESILSRDGLFLTLRPMQQPDLEVWSVNDGKVMMRIERAAHPNARPIGFDSTGRLHIATHDKGQPVVQTWDVRTRSLVSTTPLETDPANALSGNGRLLAALRPGRLRVYDLQSGKLAGERKLESKFTEIGTPEFSDDGTLLAAIVADSGAAPRLIVWSMKDGAVAHERALPSLPAGKRPGEIDLAWIPDGQGLLVNGDLVDVATGERFFAPEAPTASGSTGRAVMALSNFQTLYEIPPGPSGSRVIYRVVAHPRADVMTALRRVRGAEWSPEATDAEETAEVVAVATDANAAKLPVAAPATRAVNPATLKEWVVSILAISAPDGPSIERQLRAEQQKLGPLENKHADADRRADQLAGEYITVSDGYGGSQKKRRYSAREIGEAKGAAKRALEEVRDVKADVARLQRELKAVETTRVVTGTLDDGTPVTIYVDGTPLVALVDPLKPGAKVKVTGGPRFADGTLDIKLRTLTPVE